MQTLKLAIAKSFAVSLAFFIIPAFFVAVVNDIGSPMSFLELAVLFLQVFGIHWGVIFVGVCVHEGISTVMRTH